MLGTAIADAIARDRPDATLLGLGRASLDASRPRAVLEAVEALAPDLLVNAAAHTDVEGAEVDAAPAWLANAELPGLLATACARRGAGLVHVSSTGCYGAWKDTPYDDYDAPLPTTVHHRSKIAGEAAVRASGAAHLIVRTGWLFGGQAGQPKNFVFKRVLEAAGTALMRSDPTQTGTPTWVEPLARHVLLAWDAGMRGTCNIVAGGRATRLDYVREIVRLSGLPCTVEPSDGAFARRARVSPNEAAVALRLGLLGLDAMGSWQSELDAYMQILRTGPEWQDQVASRIPTGA